ncbi:MAG: MFS transporter [Spirochaetae bacterium HGW-Spirochaetae-1]|nr:MAG: MFS transporter [Spirochaetae bacterium HGW-Spirochaetae-1]
MSYHSLFFWLKISIWRFSVETSGYKVYGYRWVVILAFALLNGVIQLNWIAFAPITVDCIGLYNTTPFWIVFLSMSFMAVYMVMSVPALFIIERYGIRVGVGIGAVLMGVFGYLRGVYAADFTMVMISQIALAVAQPFIMNAMTKVAADWFPINERATATGITALFQFIGIIVAMAITKPLAQSYMAPGSVRLDIDAVAHVLVIYGIVSVISAVIFLVLVRNKPATPPCHADQVEKFAVFAGLKHIFQQRDVLLLLAIFFIGLGMFNAITTFIDIILASKGFIAGGNEAGNVGAIMMIAGIAGAIIIPPISDKIRKRKVIMVFCLTGMLPGIIGLTFASAYVPLLISSAIFGFFFMAAAPLGYQYAAELSHPAPEEASQGMIVLSGQISGVIFITIMAVMGNITMEILADATKASHSLVMTPFMIGFIVLSFVNVVLGLMMKESSMIRSEKESN